MLSSMLARFKTTIMPLMVGTRLYHSAIYGIRQGIQTLDRKNGSNNPVLI